MQRKIKFQPPEIEPCKVVSSMFKDFRRGCPDCGFGGFVEICDESMSRVVGLYCSGCNTQFELA